MARCKNCREEKKHRNTTYFQKIKRSRTNIIIDAFYYCHECIRNLWYVRKTISKELKRKDMHYKVKREIPEMTDLFDGGDPLPDC